MNISKQKIYDLFNSFTLLSGILGFIAVFFPISAYFNSNGSRILATIFIAIIGVLITNFSLKYIKNKILVWKNGSKKIYIKKGNILKFGASLFQKPKIVVIHVNNDFDMTVEEHGVNALISPKSIHGQWINFFTKKYNKTIEELNRSINDAIIKDNTLAVSKKKISRNEKPKGNLYRYPKGSIVPLKGSPNAKIIFYLFALNEFDEHNHNKEMQQDEFKYLFNKLIDYCNKNCQGYDVEIPIMATVHSIPKLATSQTVEIMLSILFSNVDKIKNCYTIVVSPEYFNDLKQNLEE